MIVTVLSSHRLARFPDSDESLPRPLAPAPRPLPPRRPPYDSDLLGRQPVGSRSRAGRSFLRQDGSAGRWPQSAAEWPAPGRLSSQRLPDALSKSGDRAPNECPNDTGNSTAPILRWPPPAPPAKPGCHDRNVVLAPKVIHSRLLRLLKKHEAGTKQAEVGQTVHTPGAVPVHPGDTALATEPRCIGQPHCDVPASGTGAKKLIGDVQGNLKLLLRKACFPSMALNNQAPAVTAATPPFLRPSHQVLPPRLVFAGLR